MVEPTTLYDNVRLPVDEKLYEELLKKYFEISYKDMLIRGIETKYRPVSELLYNKINIYNNISDVEFDKQKKDKLIEEVNEDIKKSGNQYYQQSHNGVNPLRIQPGWITFQSWNILGTQKLHGKDIAHRFYFGIENDKLYELASELYNRFKDANIPFYFKTNTNEGLERTDNLVLYTTTPLLEDTLKVIDQFQKERPDLIDSCKDPSIIVGKLYDKIGYASEDTYATTSYSDLIGISFVDALNKSLENYKLSNRNLKVKQAYNQKIRDAHDQKKEINDSVKNRVLLNYIVKMDPEYKETLIKDFQQVLSSKGIDLDNMCFNERARQEIIDTYGSKQRDDSFNQTITLKDGQKITINDYLEKNNAKYWVPEGSLVTLNDGKEISGKDFLESITDKLSSYNSFQEAVIKNSKGIERNPVQKEEKIDNKQYNSDLTAIQEASISNNNQPHDNERETSIQEIIKNNQNNNNNQNTINKTVTQKTAIQEAMEGNGHIEKEDDLFSRHRKAEELEQFMRRNQKQNEEQKENSAIQDLLNIHDKKENLISSKEQLINYINNQQVQNKQQNTMSMGR